MNPSNWEFCNSNSQIRIDSIRTLCFSLVAFLLACHAASADPDLIGLSFYGPNYTPYYVPTGKTAGGYIIYDQNALPYYLNPNFSFGGISASYSFVGGAATGDLGSGALPFSPGGSLDLQGISNDPEHGSVPNDFTIGSGYGALRTTGDHIFDPAHTTLQSVVDRAVCYNFSSYPSINLNPPILATFSAQDIFHNPNSLKPPTFEFGGRQIKFKFTPHVNIGGTDVSVPITLAAALFGVDHFNWKQTVTRPSLPIGWGTEIDRNPFFGLREPAPNPYVDPIDRPAPAAYLLTNRFGVSGYAAYQSGVVPDDKPFYYADTGPTGPFDVSFFTDSSSLEFSDSPTMPDMLNPDGLHTEYRTELVGVTSNGDERDTGIGCSWEGNVTYILGNGQSVLYYDSVLDPSQLPPPASGGITNVQLFGVPEPSSIALAALAALAATALRRTQRGRHA